MRRFLLTVIMLLYILASPGLHSSMNLHSGQGYIVLEDFQGYNDNPLSVWKTQSSYSRAVQIYSIIIEGDRKFLRGSTFNLNKMVQIGKLINENKLMGSDKIWWDIYKYPFISWEWRVHTLPEGADESNDLVNDSAAGLYVVFQRSRVPVVDWQRQPADWIKYVWSSTLPVGTVVRQNVTKYGITLYNGRYVVIASGRKDLKKWITNKRNVLADYQSCFGKSPRYHPSMLGIVTDSNSTATTAMADYDNIIALTD